MLVLPLFCHLKKETELFEMLPVVRAWRILGLQMEERPQHKEGSCEYAKLAVASS
jgi:hypothetical protein